MNTTRLIPASCIIIYIILIIYSLLRWQIFIRIRNGKLLVFSIVFTDNKRIINFSISVIYKTRERVWKLTAPRQVFDICHLRFFWREKYDWYVFYNYNSNRWYCPKLYFMQNEVKYKIVCNGKGDLQIKLGIVNRGNM